MQCLSRAIDRAVVYIELTPGDRQVRGARPAREVSINIDL